MGIVLFGTDGEMTESDGFMFLEISKVVGNYAMRFL